MRHDERRWRWRRLVRATPATTSAASALISAPTTTTAAARLSFGRVGEASAKRLNEESEEDEEEEEEDEEEDALARPRKNEAVRPKKRRGRRRTDRRNAMLNSVSNLALVFAGCVCVCVCFGTALAQTQAQQPPQNGASEVAASVRALVGSQLELACSVDQANCGDVYYITWTRSQPSSSLQSQSQAGSSPQQQQSSAALNPTSTTTSGQLQQQQQQWTRVYLYTGSTDSAPHKPIGDLLNRSSFHMPSQSSSTLARLVIEDARLSDEALYKCDVTYVKGKCPSISLVRAQVMQLPERARLSLIATSKLPLADNQLVGPMDEGDQLRLACSVSGGRPAPSALIWRKLDSDGRLVNLASHLTSGQAPPQTSRQPQPQQPVEVELNHTLTRADLGAKFQCHVEHDAISMHTPAARIVAPSSYLSSAPARGRRRQAAADEQAADSMLDLHPSATGSGGLAGEARELLAQDDEANGDGDERPLDALDAQIMIDLNVGIASLDLFMSKVNKRNASEPLVESDLVELECVAYNSRPAANITWFNGSELIASSDSQTAALSVAAQEQQQQQQSNPSAAAAILMNKKRSKRLLQRTLIKQSDDRLTFNTHSFLSIKLSRHENRARFECRASNAPMRSDTYLSKSVELNVQYAPIVLMEPASGIGAVESTGSGSSTPADAISVYCIFSANPMHLIANSTRWFKDGALLEPSQSAGRLIESRTPTGYPVLTIARPLRHDSGAYECQVSNAIGVSERLPVGEQLRIDVAHKASVRVKVLRAFADDNDDSDADEGKAAGPEVEVDLDKDLVVPGAKFVLQCEVLAANPKKIIKFHWYSKEVSALSNEQQQVQWRHNVTESDRLVLGPIGSDFRAHKFACAATNALGQGERSVAVELELSHAPGPSQVRPLGATLAQLKQRLTGSALAPDDSAPAATTPTLASAQVPKAAGSELVLECVTRALGRPKASMWLWLKDNRSIEAPPMGLDEVLAADSNGSGNIQADDEMADSGLVADSTQLSSPNNAIASAKRMQRRLVYSKPIEPPTATTQTQTGTGRAAQREQASGGGVAGKTLSESGMRLIANGRFLYFASLELKHKGNYSCVALNRFGSMQLQQQQQQRHLSTSGASGQPATSSWGMRPATSDGHERDHQRATDTFELKLGIGPTMERLMGAQTRWLDAAPGRSATAGPKNNNKSPLELVCRAKCEPICEIGWHLDGGAELPAPSNQQRSTSSAGRSNGGHSFAYEIKRLRSDEDQANNAFAATESRLIVYLSDYERRRSLSGTNFTCTTTPNTFGASASSTTQLQVEYAPENVLMSFGGGGSSGNGNVAGDKLTLIEGSNGPRLSCYASAEPAPRFAWFQVPTQSIGGGGGGGASNGPLLSRALGLIQSERSASADLAAARTATGSEWARSQLIELSGAATTTMTTTTPQTSRTYVSTLEPAAAAAMVGAGKIHRKHAGHYICEAWNAFGRQRRAAHVNVLYKPTAATLHLHSLDVIIAATSRLHRATANKLNGTAPNKPIKMVALVQPPPATDTHANSINDDAQQLRDTSGDFVQLRRLLAASLPAATFESGAHAPGANIIDSADEATDAAAAAASSMNPPTSSLSHWDRFNAILLGSLNGYIGQVRANELAAAHSSGKSSAASARQRLRSRSSAADNGNSIDEGDHANDSANDDYDGNNNVAAISSADTNISTFEEYNESRNLLTFACFALDANPLSNLTFDWHFGSIELAASLASGRVGSRSIIYANTNNTVQVAFVRRLDQASSMEQAHHLGPAQMSLLTLDVILIEPLGIATPTKRNHSEEDKSNKDAGATLATQQPKQSQQQQQLQNPQAVPIIKHRYQSFYNSLRPSASAPMGSQSQASAETQSQLRRAGSDPAHESDEANELAPIASQPIRSSDLSDSNWIEHVNRLLKCSVSNSIGSSESSRVQVNTLERSRQRQMYAKMNAANSLSSSQYPSDSYGLSSFERWKMLPLLAHKSLLIISVLIGCALIVFVTFALLLGPHMRSVQMLLGPDRKDARSSVQVSSIHLRNGLGGSGSDSNSPESLAALNRSSCNTAASQKRCRNSILGTLLGDGSAGLESSAPNSSEDDELASSAARLSRLLASGRLGTSGAPSAASGGASANSNGAASGSGKLVDSSLSCSSTSSAASASAAGADKQPQRLQLRARHAGSGARSLGARASRLLASLRRPAWLSSSSAASAAKATKKTTRKAAKRFAKIDGSRVGDFGLGASHRKQQRTQATTLGSSDETATTTTSLDQIQQSLRASAHQQRQQQHNRRDNDYEEYEDEDEYEYEGEEKPRADDDDDDDDDDGELHDGSGGAHRSHLHVKNAARMTPSLGSSRSKRSSTTSLSASKRVLERLAAGSMHSSGMRSSTQLQPIRHTQLRSTCANFGPTNLRHSYTGFHHAHSNNNNNNNNPNSYATTARASYRQHANYVVGEQQSGALEPTRYLYDRNGLATLDHYVANNGINYQVAAARNAIPSMVQSSAAATTNASKQANVNQLDEFMRRRGIDPTTATTSNLMPNESHKLVGQRDNDNITTTIAYKPYERPSLTMAHTNDTNMLMKHPLVYPRAHQSSSSSGPAGIQSQLSADHNNRQQQQQVARSSGYNQPLGFDQQLQPQLTFSSSSMSSAGPIQTLDPFSLQPRAQQLNYLADSSAHLANRYATTGAPIGAHMHPHLLDSNYANTSQLTGEFRPAPPPPQYIRTSAEHIYDVNAYATPEQSPLRRQQQQLRLQADDYGNNNQQQQQQTMSSSTLENERRRVSQLIQTFNSRQSNHPMSGEC